MYRLGRVEPRGMILVRHQCEPVYFSSALIIGYGVFISDYEGFVLYKGYDDFD